MRTSNSTSNFTGDESAEAWKVVELKNPGADLREKRPGTQCSRKPPHTNQIRTEFTGARSKINPQDTYLINIDPDYQRAVKPIALANAIGEHSS